MRYSFLKVIFQVVIVLLTVTMHSFGQVDQMIQSKINQELENRGVSEEEVRVKLIERGINPDNIAPQDLPNYQQVLEEIVAEIEEEKAVITDVDHGAATEEKTVVKANQKEAVKNLPVVKAPVVKAKKLSEIYGHDMFNNRSMKVFNADEITSVPDFYVLSPGDKIQVSIFGASQADFQYTIKDDGYITTTNVGKIFLKGLSVAEARKLLRSRFARKFRFLPEQFSARMIATRTVTLNILGEVENPGSYTLSAVNTALNALIAAGGVKEEASVRNIKLIKGDGKVQIVDVYDFLSNPNVQYDYALSDQDVLFVPLSDQIVTLRGAVRRPMKYEIKSGETIKDLIEFSGGMLQNANTKLVQVSSTENGQRVVNDVNPGSSHRLADLDIVTVKGASSEITSFVRVNGEVRYTGDYNFREGMTLKSILNRAELTEFSRTDFAFIFRTQADDTRKMEKVLLSDANNVKMGNRDEVIILSLKNFVDPTQTVSIVGAVRMPDTLKFNPDNDARISDLVLLAGGIKENASAKALIYRVNKANKGEKEYVEVDIYNAINSPGSVADLLVQGGDRIEVFYNERYNEIGKVIILGAVNQPDTFQFNKTLDLKKLILLAGGLKSNANDLALIKRHAQDNSKEISYVNVNLKDVENGKKVELAKGDEVRIYDKSLFIDKFDVQIFGEVNKPGTFDYDVSLKLEDLVYMAGGLTMKAATNKVEVYRVSFRENSATNILIKELTLSKESNDRVSVNGNFELEPFDIIIVRPIADFNLQEVVYVNGEVKYPGPYVLGKKDERLRDVVNRAGGLQYDAFAKGATLLRKRGDKAGKIFIKLDKALKGGSRHENIVLRGGDVLYIPQKENIVSIITKGTRALHEYADTALYNNKIQFAFQGRKSARWYIDNFAGGIDENVDKRSIRVIDPSGRIKSTRRYLGFIYNYPRVEEGSTITMGYKRPKPEREKKPIDWGKTITDIMALVSSAVTIMVVATQLNK